MARRLPNQNGEAKQAPAPELPGGAVGVIAGAATEIPNPGEAKTQAAREPGPPLDVKITRYRVMQSRPILYAGVRTELKAGKVLDTLTYDVEYLKRQGVQLECLGEV